METITKKTILIEFQGKKYALPDDSTIDDLLDSLGLTKDKPVRMLATNDGFILMPDMQ
ncbi:MAG: hypothetical protein KGH89_04540 [Thaumarchaeota archaeon]|nr:hypothetical protein [Nitrososphaerota archaeon]MDE1867191.1 hypothetical protein [Nitrososphaerota archaeon]